MINTVKTIIRAPQANLFNKIAEKAPNIPEKAGAMKKTSQGIAIIGKGWDKPVVFPNETKFIGWADTPQKVTNEQMWKTAYGQKPDVVIGNVGNTTIKGDQVTGSWADYYNDGTKDKELTQKYLDAVKSFYAPIITYFREQGVTSKNIGMAFSNSDCGIDKVSRGIADANNFKSLTVNPIDWAKYVRGKEMPATSEFPNGYILADLPYGAVFTRGENSIQDYQTTYGKMVKNGILGIFQGGNDAYKIDIYNARHNGVDVVPVDIMKECYGIEVPATRMENDKEVIRNAAALALEKQIGNPYVTTKHIFDQMPSSPAKADIQQSDPQKHMAALIYSKLAKNGIVPELNVNNGQAISAYLDSIAENNYNFDKNKINKIKTSLAINNLI